MKENKEKRVKIGDFKAHLSEYLRSVRRGEKITVCDRDTPVARVIPVEKPNDLIVREPTRDPKDVVIPPYVEHEIDSLSYLLEDRKKR